MLSWTAKNRNFVKAEINISRRKSCKIRRD